MQRYKKSVKSKTEQVKNLRHLRNLRDLKNNQRENLPETRPRDIQLGYLGLSQKEVVNEARNCSETDTGSITDMTIELTGEETRNYDRQI